MLLVNIDRSRLRGCYTFRMITIDGDKVKRSDDTIGYIDGNHIKNRDYTTIGYYEGNYVYNQDGKKLSYIEGDRLYSYESRDSYTALDTVNKELEGSVLPPIAKCAIYQLLGA